MASAPIKSPLHNFPLSFLKWGSTTPNHRFRRPLDPSDPNPPPEPDDHAHTHRNLRPRRSEVLANASDLVAEPASAPKSARLRDLAEGGSEKRDKQIWVALSKEEIEQDICALTGSKPSRRPRKRSKIVQKQLDNLLPGMWLVGMTPETYRKSWGCLQR